jgi:hypothetical protein
VGLVLIWLSTTLPFIFLYLTAQRVVIEEVRHHVMGVAIAAAAALDVADLNEIRSPEDMAKAVYRDTQRLLDRIAGANEDVRYIYTMRRSERPFTPVTSYEYIADQPPNDDNHDGVLDREEQSEVPGTPYDASDFPEMVTAWERPTADKHITPDPPYPDVISGYAPIRDEEGVARAIVGVDVTAATVHRKLLALQIVIVLVWLVISLLVMLVVHLYYQQRDAFDRIKRLNEELESRNEMLRVANLDLARHAVPQSPSRLRETKVIYEKNDLACAAYGGDLCDVFELDEDHLAFFMAHVQGSDVSAALIAGILKMAMASVRERSDTTGTLYVDLEAPDKVLGTLNDMLVRELPRGESVAVVYAVADLAEHTLRLASAGQPSPIRHSSKAKRHEVWTMAAGPALGTESGARFDVLEKAFTEGDTVLFFTHSLLDIVNTRGDTFGREFFLKAVADHGSNPPPSLITYVGDAVEAFAGTPSARDRYALLVAQFK